ncbi:ParA family protein [Enterococcus hirae]
MSKKFVIGNFKGGVGKSTCAQMLGFESAVAKKQKTLIIDLDMQGNTSDVMSLTHMNFPVEDGGGDGEPLDYQYTITDVLVGTPPLELGLEENGKVNWDKVVDNDTRVDPEKAVYKVVDNLYILPADMSFELYDDWIKDQFSDSSDKLLYMEKRLAPLLEKFDVIYLDVPPSISVYSKSAMYIADLAIVVLQTQVKSMRNAMQYLEYMDFFVDEFDTTLKVAGVIPFMLESGDAVDQEMYAQAQKIYGDHLLKNVVLKNARLKRYDGSGITMELTKAGKLKQWDRRSHELFINIYDELVEHETWYE